MVARQKHVDVRRQKHVDTNSLAKALPPSEDVVITRCTLQALGRAPRGPRQPCGSGRRE
jgi:hypothetical protein